MTKPGLALEQAQHLLKGQKSAEEGGTRYVSSLSWQGGARDSGAGGEAGGRVGKGSLEGQAIKVIGGTDRGELHHCE